QRVVDADELLVMRGTGRMMPVEYEVDPLVSVPVAVDQQPDRPARAVKRRDVPDEHADAQLGRRRDERRQEGPQLRLGHVRDEADSRIEIPRDDRDPAPGAPERVEQHAKIGGPDRKSTRLNSSHVKISY